MQPSIACQVKGEIIGKRQSAMAANKTNSRDEKVLLSFEVSKSPIFRALALSACSVFNNV